MLGVRDEPLSPRFVNTEAQRAEALQLGASMLTGDYAEAAEWAVDSEESDVNEGTLWDQMTAGAAQEQDNEASLDRTQIAVTPTTMAADVTRKEIQGFAELRAVALNGTPGSAAEAMRMELRGNAEATAPSADNDEGVDALAAALGAAAAEP